MENCFYFCWNHPYFLYTWVWPWLGFLSPPLMELWLPSQAVIPPWDIWQCWHWNPWGHKSFTNRRRLLESRMCGWVRVRSFVSVDPYSRGIPAFSCIFQKFFRCLFPFPRLPRAVRRCCSREPSGILKDRLGNKPSSPCEMLVVWRGWWAPCSWKSASFHPRHWGVTEVQGKALIHWLWGVWLSSHSCWSSYEISPWLLGHVTTVTFSSDLAGPGCLQVGHREQRFRLRVQLGFGLGGRCGWLWLLSRWGGARRGIGGWPGCTGAR